MEGAGTVGEMDAEEQSPRLLEGRELPVPLCLRLGLTLALEVTMAHALPVSHRACAPLVPQPPRFGVARGLREGGAVRTGLDCDGAAQSKEDGGRPGANQSRAIVPHPGAPCQGL